MPDSFIQNPINISLDCFIKDEFILELKDAVLYRSITYINNSAIDIPISLESKEFLYPYHCDDFSVLIDGHTPQFLIKEEGYVRKIIISGANVKLGPSKEFKFTIACRWRDFYNFLNDLHFSFRHNDVAKYQVVIKNYSISHIKYILEINGKVAVKGADYYISNDAVYINEKIVDSNTEVCIKLFSISTPNKLAILEACKEKETKYNLFSNNAIIVIQHLLSDAVHLIEAFEDLGTKKEAIFIVGIPYSTKYQTVKYLKKKGYNNILAPNKYPFEESVRQCMVDAIKYAKVNSKSIVVVEDGGYVVPLLHGEFIDDISLFLGAVEQTANGIWRDREIKVSPCIPIINVAESIIKQKLESPLIGRSVSKNIELIINKTYHSIEGVKVGIVGYGSIGTEVAKKLKSIGAIVSIYDKEALNRSSAKTNGFDIKDTIIELVKDSKVIIESTGKPWYTKVSEDKKLISEFQHGSYFVSASSKRMGINYKEFDKWIDPDSTINIPGLGVKYFLLTTTTKELTLVADGYPINFFLGESVPDFDIAFILAWLFKCAQLLVEKQSVLPKEIIDTNDQSDKWGFYAAQISIAEDHEHGMS